MAQSLDAAVWQAILYPGATGTFGDLPVGARFSFPHGANSRLFHRITGVRVFTKTSARWFADALGTKFTAGKYSAVVEVK